MKIHVAHISHEYGSIMFAARDDGEMTHKIAAYARQHWGRSGPDEPIPESDDAAISRYFDWCAEVCAGEYLTREEIDLA